MVQSRFNRGSITAQDLLELRFGDTADSDDLVARAESADDLDVAFADAQQL